ncbi:MAG: phosphate propanoyltransferase [Oscillospiraceae bacterium]|nr:phosphate propanoyltransferase [Oscillospiraceae bacterium]
MERSKLEDLTKSVLKRVFIEIEASARHVHVTREQAMALFGHELTPKRPLSQPGQYLANERLTIRGPKGEFNNVAVLGPERKEAQIEVSLTDARTLGLDVPIRASGDTAGSPGVHLIGKCGTVQVMQGVICAQRHIHMSEADAKTMGVRDKQIVRLQVFTKRPLVFEDVQVRVSDNFATYVHLDYDEANACGLETGDLGRILP